MTLHTRTKRQLKIQRMIERARRRYGLAKCPSEIERDERIREEFDRLLARAQRGEAPVVIVSI